MQSTQNTGTEQMFKNINYYYYYYYFLFVLKTLGLFLTISPTSFNFVSSRHQVLSVLLSKAVPGLVPQPLP